MDCLIRRARPEDAEGISRVIIAALRETNAKDYSAAIIARVEESFSPVSVTDLLMRRHVLVAIDQEIIAGTASLDDQVVRTVFIDPPYQGRGIGRALMIEVVRLATERNMRSLVVPSSVTAEPFYAKLGFTAVRESYHEEERTIVMERSLP